jgi:NAD(P)-dependent dehydrogenase (short-subunit alcohol dehydrogenase family)
MENKRWIVITGASTGIGKATALRLAGAGFSVIAGVRKAADAEWLCKEAPALQTAILDVTNPENIAELVARLPQLLGDAGLYGLVNNAGVVVAGPTESMTTAEWQRQYAINLFGPIALTAAMIPFLRQARGQIVNVSSIGGRFSVPFMSAYTSSKFAIEGWSDALRIELKPDGIEVVLVEPGAIATPLWEKGTDQAAQILAQLPPQLVPRYADIVKKVTAASEKTAKRAIPPEQVAVAIEAALTASKPRTRYVVGTDAKVQAMLKWLLSDRVLDRLLIKELGL